MDLHLPLHVHTPTAHVGMIIADNINDCMHELVNAAAVIELLRSLAGVPLEQRSLFLGLRPVMQNIVRDAFQARISSPGRTSHFARCDTMGSKFFFEKASVDGSQGTRVSARVGPSISPGRPLGRDLLLGSCDVWGFETASFSGCDIVHIA